jgi:hypothetical protein
LISGFTEFIFASFDDVDDDDDGGLPSRNDLENFVEKLRNF